MNKYLITGGAGFIGSNIAERLLKEGHSVRILDNLSTGRFENIKGFAEDIDFICGDLSDYSTARKATEGMDYILHHAALPSVELSVKDPCAVNESIVNSTVNLFKAAVDCGSVKRIVQAVSAAAYGNDPTLPKTEDMPPKPESPYAVAKLAQEYYARAFYNVYGLQVLSLRYFNVFGPKQDPSSFYSGVISIFSSLMLKGKSPVIFGDGLSSRDFVYIDNVVDANLKACACPWTGSSEIINIGGGQSMTLNELVEILNKILGTDIVPGYKPPRAGDVKHSMADISKASALLGYEPRITVSEGLQSLIAWYRNNDLV
ncbi:UDP-glucose 4-epimerase [Anaerobacterium chartisolvens]|uniref:UDP-glucose 4-epimerase n=1 Tax=Anaerobacterium chartisolvens TaxID=1297424 RepID=A0A369ASP3_9FIRM|nr:SDR family oxidoreductase [Anaerobacterium chartisolvens]RCX12380.1 UDP-glucose 4-epimerase [Anaerobacterium chartisolvens]